MKTLLVSLAVIAVATADVSHLTNRYLPPKQQQQQQQRSRMPSNERVETTIEQHQVIELPTQIEIFKDGQPIYGVHSMSSIELARMTPNTEPMEAQISTRYLPPSQEIENLQPPQVREQQVPYEMPMSAYLPPVEPEMTTTDMPTTTTEMFTTTTDMAPASTTPLVNEETTTTELQMSTLPMTTTEQELFESTTLAAAEPNMPRNHYLPPVMPEQQYLPPAMPHSQYLPPSMPEQQYLPPAMPQNQYIPPTMPMPENNPAPAMPPQTQYLPPMDMMLPPPSPMPQPTYQQYQEQMMREQQVQQMYREEQMNDMMDAISQMEQQKMIALEPEPQHMQPVAPVEPAHTLRDDGYHYKTADDDLRRFRYRH